MKLLHGAGICINIPNFLLKKKKQENDGATSKQEQGNDAANSPTKRYNFTLTVDHTEGYDDEGFWDDWTNHFQKLSVYGPNVPDAKPAADGGSGSNIDSNTGKEDKEMK